VTGIILCLDRLAALLSLLTSYSVPSRNKLRTSVILTRFVLTPPYAIALCSEAGKHHDGESNHSAATTSLLQFSLNYQAPHLAIQQSLQTISTVMFNPTTARLPQGSTIYITGVTGYIGAWITQYALELGYNVRGAVRSLEKAAWLQEHFNSKFGPGRYTQVLLPDSSDLKAPMSQSIPTVLPKPNPIFPTWSMKPSTS
jgi:hypothetical protein